MSISLTRSICELLREGADGSSYLILKKDGNVTTRIGKTTNPIRDYHGKDSSALLFQDTETNAVFAIKGGKLMGAKIPQEDSPTKKVTKESAELDEAAATSVWGVYSHNEDDETIWHGFTLALDKATAVSKLKSDAKYAIGTPSYIGFANLAAAKKFLKSNSSTTSRQAEVAIKLVTKAVNERQVAEGVELDEETKYPENLVKRARALPDPTHQKSAMDAIRFFHDSYKGVLDADGMHDASDSVLKTLESKYGKPKAKGLDFGGTTARQFPSGPAKQRPAVKSRQNEGMSYDQLHGDPNKLKTAIYAGYNRNLSKYQTFLWALSPTDAMMKTTNGQYLDWEVLDNPKTKLAQLRAQLDDLNHVTKLLASTISGGANLK
jgi:hypothetical protein